MSTAAGLAPSGIGGQGKAAGGAVAVALAFLLMTVDGGDMAAMPLAVPHIARDLGLAPAGFGWALSAMPLGFGLGALAIGPFGDRFGRRPLVVGTVLAVASATAATAAAHSLAGFVLCRVVTGAALGACLVNANAFVAGTLAQGVRARALTAASCGIPIGSAAAGFLTPGAVALGGWRGGFLLLAGLVLLVAVAMVVGLREPPASAAVPAGRRLKAAFVAPLAGRHRRLTLVFLALYTLNALCLYMLSAWLPTVLPEAGFTLDQAARLSSVMQVGGLVGGLVISAFVDRAKATPALVASYAVVLAALLAFGALPPGGWGWAALLLLVGGGISGAHLSIMALGATSYPPGMVASALGLATAVARLGAIGGPLLGAQVVGRHLGAPAFFLALTVPVALCAGLVCLFPKAPGVAHP